MTGNKKLLYGTAGLSIFSLIAHAIDAPDHLSEWWVYGTIFVVIAAFQFFLGVSLFLRPWRFDDEGNLRGGANDRFGRSYYFLGIILSVLIMIFYLITRTTGMPFLSPEAVREPITLLSLLPPLVNLALVGCFGMLARLTYSATEGDASR